MLTIKNWLAATFFRREPVFDSIFSDGYKITQILPWTVLRALKVDETQVVLATLMVYYAIYE